MHFCPDDITAYAEPVLRFCMKRLYDRHDAEDLAGEILAHALAGIRRSDIRSLEAWIFRVARNRYARLIAARSDLREVPLSDLPFDPETDYGVEEALVARERHAEVFRALHSLSASYRDILVDRYIRELPLQEIANTRGLTESCVKWRLSVGRDKMKNRMGDYEMEKVYSRIHMNTGACNGSMDSGEYLNRQIARAICLAAYEHPLSIEDISLCTGIPSMYIEDELPHLLYGDAVVREGGKYAANFIILRLSDSRRMERSFAPLVADVAAYFEKAFKDSAEDIRKIGFYGCDFGMRRLGYIALPAALRALIQRVTQADERLQVGPYPPRQDGGYGWFIVSETEDEQEQTSPYNSGSNQHLHKTGVMNYYWLGRYHNSELYRGGNQWMYDRELPSKLQNGILPDGLIGDEDLARLVRLNLLEKTDRGYAAHFAIFTPEQYDAFTGLFGGDAPELTGLLSGLVRSIHDSFLSFVPKRLADQINQYVVAFCHRIIAYTAEELIRRGVLETPPKDRPLTNGVYYITGKPNIKL